MFLFILCAYSFALKGSILYSLVVFHLN